MPGPLHHRVLMRRSTKTQRLRIDKAGLNEAGYNADFCNLVLSAFSVIAEN